MRSRFDAQHEWQFGHKAETQPVEIVSYRAVSAVVVPNPRLRSYSRAESSSAAAVKGRRSVYFDPSEGSLFCPIYDWERLYPGHSIQGPAIVEQMDSTTVIYPGQSASIDTFRNIIINALSSENHV